MAKLFHVQHAFKKKNCCIIEWPKAINTLPINMRCFLVCMGLAALWGRRYYTHVASPAASIK